MAEILQGARALIVTAVEEFGIAAVESQAAGRPVIARRGGGALETIVDGVTGRFWSGGPEDLAEAVRTFDDAAVDPVACVAQRPALRRGRLPGAPWRPRSSRPSPRSGRPGGGDRQPLATTRLVRRAVRDAQH